MDESAHMNVVQRLGDLQHERLEVLTAHHRSPVDQLPQIRVALFLQNK